MPTKPPKTLEPGRMILSGGPRGSDIGFWLHPSRDVRLLRLALQVLGTRQEGIASDLKVSQQRVGQWATGREPMPMFRQKQLFEIMQRRLEVMRIVIEGKSPMMAEDRREQEEDGRYHDDEMAGWLLECMDQVMREEAERLRVVDSDS